MIMTSIPGVEKEERFRVFFRTMMTMAMGFPILARGNRVYEHG